jgi:hypothetical protein
VSQLDVQWWSLVVGLNVFVVIVLATFAWRRLQERRAGRASTGRGNATPSAVPRSDLARESAPDSPQQGKRRAARSTSMGEPRELASAIRSAIMRAAAERVPAGWTALILSPPPHPEQMSWHVHLGPRVALDLQDGRTIAVGPPAATHDWQLPNGRVVAIGEGDPEPPLGHEVTTVRVTGPYLIVVVSHEGGQPPMLVARAVQAGDEELPQPRALATDLRAVQGALRDAIELAVGSRLAGSPPTAGYPRSSWSGHERIWLAVER